MLALTFSFACAQGGEIDQQGCTLIPLSLYFNENNLLKVELALCKGIVPRASYLRYVSGPMWSMETFNHSARVLWLSSTLSFVRSEASQYTTSRAARVTQHEPRRDHHHSKPQARTSETNDKTSSSLAPRFIYRTRICTWMYLWASVRILSFMGSLFFALFENSFYFAVKPHAAAGVATTRGSSGV